MIRNDRKMFLTFFLIFCLASVFVSSMLMGEGPRKVRHYEGISEYVLDNGLRVLLVPDSSKSTVTVVITYMVGSRHEIYGETGIAHVVEHMAFKGTKNFPDFREQVMNRGASYNGSTWYDRTNYYETLPATDDNLEFAIKFEADRMKNVEINEEKLTPERTVIINELDMGESQADNVLKEKMEAISYMFHGYGHSTIGAKSDVANAPLESVKAFYEKYYQPDNALLVISGKFDENKTLSLVQTHFGSIAQPQRKLTATYTRESNRDSAQEITLRRVSEVGAVGMIFHTPPAAHPDTAPLEIMESIMTDKPSGRLYQSLILTKKAAGLRPFGYTREEGGIVGFYTSIPKDKSLQEVRDIMIQSVQDIEKKPFTAEEVERAKNNFLKKSDLLIANSEDFAIEMSEWASCGDWRIFFFHRDQIKKTTPQDVQRVALSYLKPENRTIGILLPTEKPQTVEIPEAGNLETLLASYNQEVEKTEQKTFDLSPDNLEKNIRRLTLPNGMKIALLKKPSRAESVEIGLFISVCNPTDLVAGKRGINAYVADMLMKGSTKYTETQLKDELAKLKSEIRITGQNNGTMISIRTTGANVIPVCQLLEEILKHPTFNQVEFDTLKQEKINQMVRMKTEPLMVGIQFILHYLYPENHPQYTPAMDENIKFQENLQLESVKSFYNDYYGANLSRVAIAGEFDIEATQDFLTKAFGSWNSKKNNILVEDTFPGSRPVINKSIETPGKTNAMIILATNFQMKHSHPDEAALKMANYLLGGKGLRARFGDRIRTKEGFSYMVQSMLEVPNQGDNSVFGAIAIASPLNIPKTEKAFFEEIEKAANQGFTTEELENGKTAYLESRKTELAEDRSLVNEMSRQLSTNETFIHYQDQQEKIKNLTLEQVNNAMKTYIQGNKIFVVKAGDFANAGKEQTETKK